jgi:hypothetical protein
VPEGAPQEAKTAVKAKASRGFKEKSMVGGWRIFCC